MSLQCLFIDFDSYFASVEQDDDFALRGRPVGVVPVMADSTCCIAASYEAKAFGVKTGTQVAQARRLCPDIVLVLARHARYIERHHQLIAAVDCCIPVDEIASIDEMACTLTGSWQAPEKAIATAQQVKQAIADIAPHIGCSIGIAPNRFLAKTASAMNKPNGLTVLNDDDLPQALFRLDLRAINGVGARMLQRLHNHGIKSVEALYAADAATLRRVWGGIGGEHMYIKLRGGHVTQTRSSQKSIGHSHVLPPQMRAPNCARAVLHRLLQKAAWRLRREAYTSCGMLIHIRYLDNRSWRGKQRIEPTSDTLVLSRTLQNLWQQRPRSTAPLLGVGVVLTHLVCEQNLTVGLFEQDHKRSDLNTAIDQLNSRFGKASVYFGGAHGALEEAPMRIAFTQIPDPETEA